MSNNQSLEVAYQEYLKSELSPGLAKELVEVLEQSNLELESHALRKYLMEGSGAKFTLMAWGKSLSCTTSLDLPPNAEPGDLWFDPVELNLAILVPNPEGVSHHVKGWMSTHPVYVWQYKAFLNLVRIDKKVEVFAHPDDYLTSTRINNQSGLDYVTNIYHDEAIAYSSWMRKSLSGQFELNAARSYFGLARLAEILPTNLKLWESSDVEEWYRAAVGINNLDKRYALDYDAIFEENYDQLENKPDRILYQEWDCRQYIGMMTFVPVFCGLGKDSTASSFHYDFANRSPRSILSATV